jgi:sulfate adenylyltransferase subunit 2
MLLATEGDLIPRRPEEKVEKMMVRCRTIGDITTTGVWESEAATLEDIIA